MNWRHALATAVLVAGLCSDGRAAFAQATATNMLAGAAGADIVQRSTERPGQTAANLLDDHGAATGWASAEAVFPQTIMFRLAKNQPFNQVVINPAGDPDPRNWLKILVISTADPFPHMGGWTVVTQVELAPVAKSQVFSFEEARGRYLRLEIRSAQSVDATWVSIGSVELFQR